MRCCHSAHGLLFRDCAGGHQRGSAAVCAPNPPRPYARSRSCCKITNPTCTIGAKIITHTTFSVGKLICDYAHTRISYTTLTVDELICATTNACVSLVSVCLASMISWKRNYTTIMLGELTSNHTHTSYTTIIVGELPQDTQPPLTLRQGLDNRGRVPDASP